VRSAAFCLVAQIFGGRNTQDRLSTLDQVAVFQVCGRDFLAVDVGAVFAAHVLEAALRGIDLDHEVNAREELAFSGS